MRRLIHWIKLLPLQLFLLIYSVRDHRTPVGLKWATFGLLVYVVSPIDLLPDFIPFFGFLDDAVLFPFGVGLILKKVPEEVIREGTQKASRWLPWH